MFNLFSTKQCYSINQIFSLKYHISFSVTVYTRNTAFQHFIQETYFHFHRTCCKHGVFKLTRTTRARTFSIYSTRPITGIFHDLYKQYLKIFSKREVVKVDFILLCKYFRFCMHFNSIVNMHYVKSYLFYRVKARAFIL